MTERGRLHTIQEWLAQPPERRLELIDGEFIEKAAPGMLHGMAQVAISIALGPALKWKPGWWIASEVDIQLGENGFRPDMAGWRRERCPTPIEDRPVVLRPDWICEVLSDSNRHDDTIRKLRRYHQAGATPIRRPSTSSVMSRLAT